MALKEDTLLSLFIIDADNSALSDQWAGRLYLVSPELTGGKDVKYVDETGAIRKYKPSPVAFGGVEISGSNKLPTPKVFFGNVDGGMSDMARDFDDLIGFKLVRIRTYAKYLYSIDGIPQSGYNSGAHFTPDTWYFNRKIDESKLGVTYELASIFDVEGLRIPKRRLHSNFCPFEYRGPDCQYAGSNVPTAGKADGCEKSLEACRQHFGNNADLRFGGFPTAQN
tara:strand:- start:4953 stop:5624 length:672 start_codon:yes stop_codon:yes gene_type:complete